MSGNNDDEDTQVSPMALRINYLTNAAVVLSTALPSISHYFMRTALCYLKDCQIDVAKGQYLYICSNCGVLKMPCINTKIRCESTTKSQRQKLRRRHILNKAKETGILIKNKVNIYHQNVMVYTCKLCNNRTLVPGVIKHIKREKV